MPESPTPNPSGAPTGSEQPEFLKAALEGAPEDVRKKIEGFGGWANHKDLPSVLSSYVEAQGMVGKIKGGQFVEKPAKGALPADLEKFWGQLGRPDSTEGYNAAVETVLKALPAGTQINKGILSRAISKAHKTGVLPDQFAGVMGEYLQASIEELAAVQGAQQQQQKATLDGVTAMLRGEYGAKYDEKMAMAVDLVAEIFDDDKDPSVAFLRESGLDKDPRLARFLMKVIDKAGEETIFGGKFRAPGLGEKSEQEISDRTREIRKTLAKTGEGAPSRKDREMLQKEMDALYLENAHRKGPRRVSTIAAVSRG